MAITKHAYGAGRAVVSSFARTLGCRAERGAFDLYAFQPLGADAILKAHSEGDTTFDAMARGYRVGFNDSDLEPASADGNT
ncbi:hypothetical protein G6K98_31645 [Agrobacterium rhizogenes]|nr:hypothetical protein [Rhizobium rhizogenes]NTH62080.1 hypothetical protein [Rhizobium rhizogenes]NTH93706.1 hypothetical protein [Rhizobium rhizogenes]